MKISAKMKLIAGLAFICVLYGSVTGLFTHGSAKAPNSLFWDRVEPYQNLSLLLGAGVGIVVFAIAYLVFNLIRRSNITWFGAIFVIFILAGITIGFTSSLLVHHAADNFGLLTNGTASSIFDASVAAFFGGVFGLGVAVVVNEHL